MARSDSFARKWASAPAQFERPSNTLISRGWAGGAGEEPPEAKWENWWHNRVDEALAEIESQGALQWFLDVSYRAGAITHHGEAHWVAAKPSLGIEPGSAEDDGHWVPASYLLGAGIHRRAVFFASGTWLCPPGVTRINATGCGAGGGGGGATAASTVHGQGGGAGASAFCVSLDVTPGMTYMVSIGTAGAGGAVGSNGSAGGASSIGSLLTLTGGAGGLATGSGSGGGGGTPAPIAPGTSRGGNGADGPVGGHGGSSSFGGGGSARQSAGSAGAGWGSGGAGGRPGSSGGPGADGFLILEW